MPVFATHPAEPLAGEPTTDIRHWRERLLDAILRIGTLVGAIPALWSCRKAGCFIVLIDNIVAKPRHGICVA